MKIIQAMKEIKHLAEKAADLREKVAAHSAQMDYETQVYADTTAQIKEWIQSHFDTVQEIARLRVAISRTNLMTQVTIELGGKQVTKTIAEWIHRRKDLAKVDQDMWSKLTDRNLREAFLPTTQPGQQQTRVTIRRYYDPAKRDEMIAMYRREPSLIDATLEVINATTELVEA